MDYQPSSYPRRVLLAVAGLSPQVVTETLYALAVTGRPAFIPTEVRLITSSEGAERARLALLSADPGWFERLRRDYALPPIAFGHDHIQILHDAAGRPLADIRDEADNESVADCITATVRTLTADPDCALHVSIAGGRKTMGYYAGYALSLFGRSQDRLSHVLVSDPYEQSWDFFYPTPASRIITTRDNKLADTKDARVSLALVPFVRLREGLPERLLAGIASFGASIAAAQRALRPPRLTIDLAGQRIRAAGEIIPLAPAVLAFYAMLARRRCQGLHPARWDSDGIDRQYLAEYRRIVGAEHGEYERAETALADGMTAEYFDQRKSRSNSALIQALGTRLAAAYLIQPDGKRPRTRYRLALEPAMIDFAALDAAAPASDTAAPPG
ncbi:MAG: TIGR02584 family CRISPR-associated protein [Chromatiaceae bacterium]|nr:MAG: TIGR02584 family CRISPR-associated protein [Chromatiaceae bacterium]